LIKYHSPGLGSPLEPEMVSPTESLLAEVNTIFSLSVPLAMMVPLNKQVGVYCELDNSPFLNFQGASIIDGYSTANVISFGIYPGLS